jgi:hypothetical protein
VICKSADFPTANCAYQPRTTLARLWVLHMSEETSKTGAAEEQIGASVLEVLLQQLEKKHADAKDALKACKLLKQRSKRDAEEWATFKITRVLAALISVTKTYPEDADLHAEFTDMVAGLLCHQKAPSNDLTFFLREGGLDAVVKAMSQNKTKVEVQIKACAAICGVGNEVLSLQRKTKQTIARAILSAMELYAQDEDFVMHGISALAFLGKEPNRDVTQQCITAVLNGMRAHPRVVSIQSKACSALCIMGRDCVENIAIMWAQGVLDLCVSGLSGLVRGTFKPSQAASHFVQEEQTLLRSICWLIQTMYDQASERMQHPGLAVLSQVMVKYMRNPDSIKVIMGVLAEVTRNCKKNKEILGRQSIRALILVLNTYKGNAEIRRLALFSIGCLIVSTQSNVMHLGEPNALRNVVQSWYLCMQDPLMCKESAMTIILVMAHLGSRSIRQAILDSDVVQTIANWVILHVGMDPKAVDTGARALSVLILAMSGEDHAASGDPTLKKVDNFLQHMSQLRVAEAITRAMPDITEIKNVFPCIQALINLMPASAENTRICGLSLIRQIVGHMLSLNRYQASSSEFLVQQQLDACDVVQIIFQDARQLPNFAAFQDEFRECGGIKAILGFLPTCCQKPRGSEGRLEIARLSNSCVSLLCLGVVSNQRSQDVCAQEPTLFNMIFRILAKYCDDADLQYNGCCCLRALSHRHVSNLTVVLNDGGLECLKRALTVLQGDPVRRVVLQDALDYFVKAVELVSELQSSDENAGGEGRNDGACSNKRGDVTLSEGVSFGAQELRLGEGTCTGDDNTAVKRSQKHSGDVCVACGKSAADVGVNRLLKCSACTVAPRYCSAECQSACWKAHKAECKTNRKAPK